MAEQLDLPARVGPTTILWRIRHIHLERGVDWDNATATFVADPTKSLIAVLLIGENGQSKLHEWKGAIADQRLVALNKANLNPPNTLNRRILQALLDDAVIAGAISGAAD